MYTTNRIRNFISVYLFKKYKYLCGTHHNVHVTRATHKVKDVLVQHGGGKSYNRCLDIKTFLKTVPNHR